MSLPVTDDLTRSTQVGPEGPEFWIKPCGFTVTGSEPPEPDFVLAENYALQLGVDLSYVNNWKENFCQDKFRMSFDAKVAEDAPFRYDWLQVSTTIPKKPSESLSATYYSQEEFSAMLTESSNIFQRLAVGWEQVDYEKTDASYKDLFTSTKNRMKNTLCQLDYYLAEKRMSPAPNPTRAIMPTELRTITSASQRDERNFRILKEYVNAIEYYADGFNYFKTSLSSKMESSL